MTSIVVVDALVVVVVVVVDFSPFVLESTPGGFACAMWLLIQRL